MSANLADAGVDGVLVETMPTVREAVAATAAATETGLPTLVSFVCDDTGRLLSGESLTDAIRAVRPFAPSALLVNCLPADAVIRALAKLQTVAADLPVGAYANAGRFVPGVGWEDTAAVDPDHYAAAAVQWRAAGATLIGSCCGTTPAHIRRLRELLPT
jgi:S-methylmethionine-dependent homocysteine/selenocysteine methylase